MENQNQEPIVNQESVSAVEEPRFKIKVVQNNDEFILDFPAKASYHEAFNVCITMMLSVYDMSKKNNTPVTEPTPTIEGEANG